MHCKECGHRWEINFNQKIRMDIDTDIGEQPRCCRCESADLALI
ncbi:MAG: hypothetical protein V1678_01355 [Candidatus Aenigmatarchaeota archaeon]